MYRVEAKSVRVGRKRAGRIVGANEQRGLGMGGGSIGIRGSVGGQSYED